MTDARVDRHRTAAADLARASIAARADAGPADAGRRGRRRARRRRAMPTHRVIRALEMRYLGQNYELELPIDFDALRRRRRVGAVAGLPRAHQARFGFDIPGETIEIVNFTATAVSPPPQARSAASSARRAGRRSRSARRAGRLRRRPPRRAGLRPRRTARRPRASPARRSSRRRPRSRSSTPASGSQVDPLGQSAIDAAQSCGRTRTMRFSRTALHREIRQVRELRRAALRAGIAGSAPGTACISAPTGAWSGRGGAMPAMSSRACRSSSRPCRSRSSTGRWASARRRPTSSP